MLGYHGNGTAHTNTTDSRGETQKRKNKNAHLAPCSYQDGAGMNLVQDSDANVDAWSLVAATYPDSRRFTWIGFRCESTIR